MKYGRFEDLPVWNTSMELGDRVYALTRARLFHQSGDLRDQLRRAVLSISNNIAEGFERGSTAELLMFLYIARGSAGEVRSMLRFVERLLDRAEARVRETGGGVGVGTPREPERPEGLDLGAGWQGPESEISNAKSEISDLKSEISNSKSEISNPRPGITGPRSQSPAPSANATNPVSEIAAIRTEVRALIVLAESCSRQIRGWADSLQNSDIQGQRHLDDRVRKQYEAKGQKAAFLKHLAEVRRLHSGQGHPNPPAGNE